MEVYSISVIEAVPVEVVVVWYSTESHCYSKGIIHAIYALLTMSTDD